MAEHYIIVISSDEEDSGPAIGANFPDLGTNSTGSGTTGDHNQPLEATVASYRGIRRRGRERSIAGLPSREADGRHFGTHDFVDSYSHTTVGALESINAQASTENGSSLSHLQANTVPRLAEEKCPQERHKISLVCYTNDVQNILPLSASDSGSSSTCGTFSHQFDERIKHERTAQATDQGIVPFEVIRPPMDGTSRTTTSAVAPSLQPTIVDSHTSGESPSAPACINHLGSSSAEHLHQQMVSTQSQNSSSNISMSIEQSIEALTQQVESDQVELIPPGGNVGQVVVDAKNLAAVVKLAASYLELLISDTGDAQQYETYLYDRLWVTNVDDQREHAVPMSYPAAAMDSVHVLHNSSCVTDTQSSSAGGVSVSNSRENIVFVADSLSPMNSMQHAVQREQFSQSKLIQAIDPEESLARPVTPSPTTTPTLSMLPNPTDTGINVNHPTSLNSKTSFSSCSESSFNSTIVEVRTPDDASDDECVIPIGCQGHTRLLKRKLQEESLEHKDIPTRKRLKLTLNRYKQPQEEGGVYEVMDQSTDDHEPLLSDASQPGRLEFN